LSAAALRPFPEAHGGPQGYGLAMNNSMKMMWACVALLGAVVVLSVAGANSGYLLFLVPCMLMMGVMMWMMMGVARGGDQK